MKNDSLIHSLLQVPVWFIFLMLVVWVALIAGLFYLMLL